MGNKSLVIYLFVFLATMLIATSTQAQSSRCDINPPENARHCVDYSYTLDQGEGNSVDQDNQEYFYNLDSLQQCQTFCEQTSIEGGITNLQCQTECIELSTATPEPIEIATPQQCQTWQQSCAALSDSDCESGGNQEQCQLITEGVRTCVARMDKCSQACFVDKDFARLPGTDDIAGQYCEASQSECLERRDSIANDDMGNNYDVLFQYGACGPAPQASANSVYSSAQCKDIIRPNCQEYNGDRAGCLTAEFSVEEEGVEVEYSNVCQYQSTNFAADGICVPKLTPQICGNYCRADVDGSNEATCYDSFDQCVESLVAIDPDEIATGSCNVFNVSVGGTAGGSGGLTGEGINAAFDLNGFKPFENVQGLYIDGEETSSLPRFINNFLGFAIGLAGVAVVAIIVAGGFQYVTAAAGAKKNDAKQRIAEGLGGLVLLLSSVALLNTLNPRLLNLDALRPINVSITREEYRGDFNSPGGFIGSVDDLYRDSTNITCANGTNDAGLETGYYRGESYQIRLCALTGITDVSGEGAGGPVFVNSRISSNAQAMINEMNNTPGLSVAATDSFRTNDRQQELYDCWLAREPRCNQAAEPGYSRHQSGNAIDFVAGGVSGGTRANPAQAPNSPTWVWLSNNAGRFGMQQFYGESWHWSPDGY